MSEISDMVSAGIICMTCGVYLGDEVGFPRTCRFCTNEYWRQKLKRKKKKKNKRKRKVQIEYKNKK